MPAIAPNRGLVSSCGLGGCGLAVHDSVVIDLLEESDPYRVVGGVASGDHRVAQVATLAERDLDACRREGATDHVH